MAVDPRKTLPTKINLIKLKKEYKTIKKIRGVLEEKRNALILFVRTMITEYQKLYETTSKELDNAYREYRNALLLMGYEKARKVSETIPASLEVEIIEKTLFAVKVPALKIKEETYPRMTTELEVPTYYLVAVEHLQQAFKNYMKMVELETAIRKMIKELKNTQRLINSIDYAILPSYERTIKHIKLVLDERMREEFMRLKVLKRKREKQEANQTT